MLRFLFCNAPKVHDGVSKRGELEYSSVCHQNIWETCFIKLYLHPDTDGSNSQLLLSLSQNLLRSLGTQEGLPNPSVHIALRLSSRHNPTRESEHLDRLKNNLHNDLQRYHTAYKWPPASVPLFIVMQQIQSRFPLNLFSPPCSHLSCILLCLSALSLAASLWRASWRCTLWLWSPPVTTSTRSPSPSLRGARRCWRTWRSRWS